ncbi:MAG: TerB N-terminal domain-containing protein [Eubacteriales bacterium]
MANSDFKNSNKKKADDSDPFWDIDFMLPPKKTTAAFSRDTEAVEIDVAHDPAAVNAGSVIPKKGTAKPESAKSLTSEPICTYKPENPLISKVSVWHWPSKYSFYERFRADAIKYYSLIGSECPFTAFFSYMPQYMQLNSEQRAYYLWWRDNVRNRIWLQTDYSYVFLYIYEIINLPDLISPVKGLELLCDIWLAYRTQFPKLDRYLTEWVCDFCLVNLMEPPYMRLAPIMGAVLDCASFKEFYLKTNGNSIKPYAVALLNFATNYNWRSGKFYNAETAELFDKHIEGAFFSAVSKLSATDSRFTAGDKIIMPARLTRDAFAGSLCAYNIKRRIDVEYSSCTRSPELRMLVTDLIKCAENQVRIILGIKNRFSTSSLTEEMKNSIIEYFEPYKMKKKAREDEVPEYMKLYEAAARELSPDSALDIEKRSWDVTSRLVDAFAEVKDGEESFPAKVAMIETVSEGEVISDAVEEPDLISSLVREGLNVIADGGNKFSEWAFNNNMMPDTAAEMINEALYDMIGDIVLENNGSGYSIIEDYMPEIGDIIKGSKTI